MPNVLTVDVGLIRKVDTRNAEDLISLWTVFSRCAGSLEEGRRLENLSWRLWNRETCCDPVSAANATTPAISRASKSSEEFNTNSSSTYASLDITYPQIHQDDSVYSRSRGQDRHITPADLEKMVITITEKKDLEPLSPSSHTYLAPLAVQEPEQTTPEIVEPVEPSINSDATSVSTPNTQASSASATSEKSTTSVVRGFSASQISSSYRTIPLLTAPSSHPTTGLPDALASKSPQSKKNQMFALGESRPLNKKVVSFNEEVATRTIKEEQLYDSDIFETDEDGIDESAIDDDDDSSDWADSVEDIRNANIDEKTFFQHVDSRPNLTPRRSLITIMLHQNDRTNALTTGAIASKSTLTPQRSRISSLNALSLAASPDSDDTAPFMTKKGLKSISEIPRSTAQPIIQTTTNTTLHQLALSPRTTRRNMLASELTVSLREHLLWERKQKSQTAKAVLKRRHVGNLTQYPEQAHMDNDGGNKSTWNDYYGQGLGEYHSKGW